MTFLSRPSAKAHHRRTFEEVGTLNALSIILCDDKKPEYLQMALTEVARQIGAGETSGMVHGLSWEKWFMDCRGR